MFSTGQDRVVETQTRGSKRLLRLYPDMERAVISCVEQESADPDWRGLLYLMGWWALFAETNRKYALGGRRTSLRKLSNPFSECVHNRNNKVTPPCSG